MPDEAHPKAAWVSIGKQVLTFVAGVVAASFVLGSARQRVSDLATWKAEVAPRIERIDREGTISFSLFYKNYEKREEAMEIRVKDIEKEIKDLEKRVDP